jgi:hypothetical protein
MVAFQLEHFQHILPSVFYVMTNVTSFLFCCEGLITACLLLALLLIPVKLLPQYKHMCVLSSFHLISASVNWIFPSDWINGRSNYFRF